MMVATPMVGDVAKPTRATASMASEEPTRGMKQNRATMKDNAKE